MGAAGFGNILFMPTLGMDEAKTEASGYRSTFFHDELSVVEGTGGTEDERIMADAYTPGPDGIAGNDDGVPLDDPWIQHDQISGGGTLALVMGDTPSDWGIAD